MKEQVLAEMERTLALANASDWAPPTVPEGWWADHELGCFPPEAYPLEPYPVRCPTVTGGIDVCEDELDFSVEVLDELVRDGTLGRSYVHADDEPGIPGMCISRHYYYWVRTPETAERDKRLAQRDRQRAEKLRSINPNYGRTFVFGFDAEVLDLN